MSEKLVRDYFEDRLTRAFDREDDARAVLERSGVNTNTAAMKKAMDYASAQAARRTLQDVAREVHGLRSSGGHRQHVRVQDEEAWAAEKARDDEHMEARIREERNS